MVMKTAKSRLIIRNGRHIMSVTSFIITRRKFNQEEEEEAEEEEVIEAVGVNLSLIKTVVEEVEVEETIITRASISISSSSSNSSSSSSSSSSLNNKYTLAILSSIIIPEISNIKTIITIMAKGINNRSIKKSHTTRKKG